jgi:hypothetical protein
VTQTGRDVVRAAVIKQMIMTLMGGDS